MHTFLNYSCSELIVPDKISQIYDKLIFELHEMVSRRTNFGEGSKPAPDRGGKFQLAGGGGGGVELPSPANFEAVVSTECPAIRVL